MVNLSHPQLRPEMTRQAIRYYSQHSVDLLDLEKNHLTTVPTEEVLGADFPALRWLASVDDGDTVRPPAFIGPSIEPKQLILTFDGLLQRSEFVPLLKKVLTRLAEQYELPVDIEFAVSVLPGTGKPGVLFHLLQCRPQNSLEFHWRAGQGAAEGPARAGPASSFAAAWCRRVTWARSNISSTSTRKNIINWTARRITPKWPAGSGS